MVREFKEGQKIHSRNQDELSKSKFSSSFGVRDLHIFNLSLLRKLAWWHIQNPDSLWARMLKSIYFPNNASWKLEKNLDPYGLQSLLAGRDTISRHLLWSIGDGKNINFFRDSWIPSLPEYRLSQEVVDEELLNLKVKELMNRFYRVERDMRRVEHLLIE